MKIIKNMCFHFLKLWIIISKSRSFINHRKSSEKISKISLNLIFGLHIVSIVSSISARKLKCPSSARNLHTSARSSQKISARTHHYSLVYTHLYYLASNSSNRQNERFDGFTLKQFKPVNRPFWSVWMTSFHLKFIHLQTFSKLAQQYIMVRN